MRKILVVVCLLLIAEYTCAQNYTPFDTNGVWHIYYEWYNAGSGTGGSGWQTYDFCGTSISQGASYNNLCRHNNQSNPSHTLIREDTLQKKIFIVPLPDSVEYLLFDFNLQVGDTLKGYDAYPTDDESWPYLTVESIDSILIGNVFRKRFNITTVRNL